MDPAAFSALVERCAPTPDLVRPLAAIMRQASSFEPLLITILGRKPIPIQANDRDEAIQLATEAIATGQPVRTGLAQLDADETKKAGLTTATTFDACKHIAGLGRLFEARLKAANLDASGRDQAIASVVAGFAAKASGTTPDSGQPTAFSGVGTSNGDMPTINAPAASARERPKWDVYRSDVGRSAFVYERWGTLCFVSTQQRGPDGSGCTANRSRVMTSPLKNSTALVCMGAVLSIALVEPALAQTANIEGVLQNIVNMLTGNVARLLATLAVIIVGIAWMFGYLDLRKAAYVVLGVAITFGASEVVSTLTGGR